MTRTRAARCQLPGSPLTTAADISRPLAPTKEESDCSHPTDEHLGGADTHMIIDELLKVMPIPASPAETGKANDWGPITAKLGGPLPTDYMMFVDRFGSGTVNDFLTPFNP